MTELDKPEQTAVNDSGTEVGSDTRLTHGRSPDVHSWTYFVRDGDMIKIGSSVRPHKRVESIQTGSSRTIELLVVVSQTVADEFTTHQKFSHLRTRGEWFRAAPDLLDYIQDLKATVGDYVEPAPEPLVRLASKPMPEPVIRGVLKRRNKVGSQTPEGHVLSNIVKLTRSLNDPEPRPWATHQTQTVQWMMNLQLKLLAKYSAA